MTKPYCNDLKFSLSEFQKEIDEHKIKDEDTLKANDAVVDAFGFACTKPEPPDCDDLIRASGIWKEEIHKYTNVYPIIPTIGRLTGKGPAYYKRVQNGVDEAIRDLGCKVE